MADAPVIFPWVITTVVCGGEDAHGFIHSVLPELTGQTGRRAQDSQEVGLEPPLLRGRDGP